MNFPGVSQLPAMPIWQDVSVPKKVEKNPLNIENFKLVVWSTAGGAGFGYGVYWIARFIDQKKWLEINSKGINPVSCTLVLAINAAVTSIAVVIYNFSLYLIGNREDFENLANPQNASLSDRLRHRCWKVVVVIEGLEEAVDAIYSRTFHVRTSKEIRENQIPDRNLANMEIVRYALVKQIQETALGVINCIPGEIGVCTAEALGYTVLGGHVFMLFIYYAPLLAVLGLVAKIMDVKNRVMDEQNKEAVERAAGNKEKEPLNEPLVEAVAR